MTFQPKARHKGPRWLVLLAVLMLGSAAFAATASAAHFPSTFPNFAEDDQGANDEPGQKDLTAQGSVIVSGTLYSMWQWDDTSWSGNNTGDGCSLFTIDADSFVDYALCATVGTKNATLQTVSVYSCGDTREDRCTNPTLLTTNTSLCEINNLVENPFDGGNNDTQAVCTTAGTTIPSAAVLLNSCSYPSQQPNSDPSDCVLTVANVDTTVSTTSAGSIAWTATLSDSATLSPNTATGTVTFKLYSDATCSTLIWTSDAISVASGAASSGTTGGSPSGGNVITNLTVNGTGEYYWIADYTPTGAFNADSSACGEKVTIVATVTGSSGS